MNFPEEQLGRVGQKFSDIGRKIEHIKTLDLVSCVAEVEQLCGEIQAATEEMRHIHCADEVLTNEKNPLLAFIANRGFSM